MKTIKSLNPKSVFKVSLILGVVAGSIVGTIIMITDVIQGRIMEGVFIFFSAPVLYGVIGALVNLFMAKIYNLVSDRVGGIEVELE